MLLTAITGSTAPDATPWGAYLLAAVAVIMFMVALVLALKNPRKILAVGAAVSATVVTTLAVVSAYSTSQLPDTSFSDALVDSFSTPEDPIQVVSFPEASAAEGGPVIVSGHGEEIECEAAPNSDPGVSSGFHIALLSAPVRGSVSVVCPPLPEKSEAETQAENMLKEMEESRHKGEQDRLRMQQEMPSLPQIPGLPQPPHPR